MVRLDIRGIASLVLQSIPEYVPGFVQGRARFGSTDHGKRMSGHERNLLSRSPRTFGRASTITCPRNMSRI